MIFEKFGASLASGHRQPNFISPKWSQVGSGVTRWEGYRWRSHTKSMQAANWN